MVEPHVHEVQIYYEDTDFSGVVYHANYLRYFERAREHILGTDVLVDMWRNTGVGFVVYKADITYKDGASFGDVLDIRTTAKLESEYRIIFDQRAYERGSDRLFVQADIHLACVDGDKRLVKLPQLVMDGMRERFEPS
jgi:tol-pal system-associated acyl-CoA thioesterase